MHTLLLLVPHVIDECSFCQKSCDAKIIQVRKTVYPCYFELRSISYILNTLNTDFNNRNTFCWYYLGLISIILSMYVLLIVVDD